MSFFQRMTGLRLHRFAETKFKVLNGLSSSRSVIFAWSVDTSNCRSVGHIMFGHISFHSLKGGWKPDTESMKRSCNRISKNQITYSYRWSAGTEQMWDYDRCVTGLIMAHHKSRNRKADLQFLEHLFCRLLSQKYR